MKKKILIYLALMVLGLYAMPQTVALFAGQHSFYSGLNVSCVTCHSDILGELNASTVYNRHRDAAANVNYTTYLAVGGISYTASSSTINTIGGDQWTWNSTLGMWRRTSDGATKLVKLDVDNNGIEGDELCRLCHDGDLYNLSAHAAITRTCDDDRCHGNAKNNYNAPALLGSYYNVTGAGYILAQNNAHSFYYLNASNASSQYGAGKPFNSTPGNADPSGIYLSRGYYACVSCHSGIVLNVTVVSAPPYPHNNSSDPQRRY